MTLLLHIPILIIIFTIVNIFFNKQKKRSINSYQPTLDTGDRVFINLLVSVFYGLIVMIITLLTADFKSEDTLKYVKVTTPHPEG
jgi:multisubunit Na+/H+ antiporter MnhB subunit